MLKKKKKKNQLKSQFKSQRKKKSHKLQIQLFILMSVLVTNNPNVWNLNYFRIKFQKQQKILDNFVLEKKELAIVESHYIIKIQFSIDWLKILWFKEEILKIAMELEEKAYMEKNLVMKIFQWNTLEEDYYQWLIQVKILMEANFL